MEQFFDPHIPRLLEMANDVEKNPGPPKIVKNGLINVNGKVAKKDPNVPVLESAEKIGDFEDLKHFVEKQNELIKQQRSEIELLRKQMEKHVHITQDFQSELSEIRKNWQSISNDDKTNAGNNNGNGSLKKDDQVVAKLEALASAYNDIQDRLYELDKSWKNNLMIYGVPCCEGEEDDPIITEEKVKEVLLKKLHISREILMNRVCRLNYGPDFRGHKPIQVCLVNYRDKEELLRKARLLKGSNIYISEDFSRKVREHRNELIKFMKEVKTRDPTRRMTLRYDKLYIGNDVFFFNDRMGRVERLHHPLEIGNNTTNPTLNNLIVNDSQASYHDSTWLRRPRSRLGNGVHSSGSRCATPLSRQNSMSMEDFQTSMMNNTPRMATSASRFRRSNPGSPRKSVSVESSLHQYSVEPEQTNFHPQHNQHNQHRQNSAHYREDYSNIPVADTPIPHHAQYPVVPQYHQTNGGGYMDHSGPRSNHGSPTKKMVAFRDHVLTHPLMHNPVSTADDQLLALETAGHDQQITYDNTTTALAPYTNSGLANNTSITLPSHLTNGGGPNRAIVHATPALPSITQQPTQTVVPVQALNSAGQPLVGPQNKYMMHPAYAAMENGKKNAFPALLSPNNGALEPAYVNGLTSDSEDEELDKQPKRLEIEYKKEEEKESSKVVKEQQESADKQGVKSKDDNSKVNNATTANGNNNGVVKVAMYGEFSMSNFHQCK